MKPEPKPGAEAFAKSLEAFDRLPAKAKELEILRDRAEKSTGPESVALNTAIRKKAAANGK